MKLKYWVLGLALGFAAYGLVGCGMEPGTDVTEIQSAQQDSAYLTIFTDRDNRLSAPAMPDWSVGNAKTDCYPSSGLVIGISERMPGVGAQQPHILDCNNSTWAVSTTDWLVLNVNHRDDQRYDYTRMWGDWSVGNYKAACPAGYGISGIAINPAGRTTVAVRCSRVIGYGAAQQNLFDLRLGDFRESWTVPFDWDVGYVKGECGSGRFMVAMSFSAASGSSRPVAMICAGLVPGPR